MVELLAAVGPNDGLQRIALALGALGTFLGFVNLAINAFELWRDRSNLQLSLAFSSSVITPFSTKLEPYKYVSLTVTNRGRRPVQVTGVGLLLKDGSTLPALVNSAGHAPFPAILDERNPSVTAGFEFLPLNQRLTEEGQAKLSRLFCWLGTGERKTAPIRGDWMKTLTARYGVRTEADD